MQDEADSPSRRLPETPFLLVYLTVCRRVVYRVHFRPDISSRSRFTNAYLHLAMFYLHSSPATTLFETKTLRVVIPQRIFTSCNCEPHHQAVLTTTYPTRVHQLSNAKALDSSIDHPLGILVHTISSHFTHCEISAKSGRTPR